MAVLAQAGLELGDDHAPTRQRRRHNRHPGGDFDIETLRADAERHQAKEPRG